MRQQYQNVKLEVFAPPEAVAAIQETLHTAGAGHVGNYDHCATVTEVTGRSRRSLKPKLLPARPTGGRLHGASIEGLVAAPLAKCRRMECTPDKSRGLAMGAVTARIRVVLMMLGVILNARGQSRSCTGVVLSPQASTAHTCR